VLGEGSCSVSVPARRPESKFIRKARNNVNDVKEATMNGTYSAGLGRDKVWTQDIWADIDKAVTAEVGQVRVVQKVFPTTAMPNAQSVPADVFDPTAMTIQEGQTKPLVEIFVAFPLTQSQVENEATQHTGQKLARLSAKSVALAEDTIFFQGQNVALPQNVQVVNIASTHGGLINEAASEIQVDRVDFNYPATIFQAVVQGISQLTAHGYSGPYGLFLENSVYADAHQPSPSLVTTADRIVPLVKGGFYSTGTLLFAGQSPPQSFGLLASLAGEPVSIYVGVDAVSAFTQADPGGVLRFRVFERVQFVVRDPRALLRLRFIN
jgi:uncharacterized linocin/CFP29 family protein